MFTGLKNKANSVSWSEYLEIEDIYNGVIKLSNNRYRAFLEIFPIPLSHCSEQELMQVYHGWRNFLVALDLPIAIFIQSRQVDLDSVIKMQRETRYSFINKYNLTNSSTEDFYIEQEKFNIALMDNKNLPIRRNNFIFFADDRKFSTITEASDFLLDRIEEAEYRIKVFSRRQQVLDNVGVVDLIQAWMNKKQSRYITGSDIYHQGFQETFLVKGVPMKIEATI